MSDRVLLQIEVRNTTHNILMARDDAEVAVGSWTACEGKITVKGVIDHRDANACELIFEGSECSWMCIVGISRL